MEVVLPLGTTAVVRGMTGNEEDTLMDQRRQRDGTALDLVMAACTESLTDVEGATVKETTASEGVSPANILHLRGPERLALLLAVRKETYGDQVDVDLVCPNCTEKFSVTADLTSLKEHPAPSGGLPYEITLADGTKVYATFPDGKAERYAVKATEDRATIALLMRIERVEGVDDRKLKAWLKKLPMRLRLELRSKLEASECGPITDLTADCASCGEEVAFNVVATERFFRPAP